MIKCKAKRAPLKIRLQLVSACTNKLKGKMTGLLTVRGRSKTTESYIHAKIQYGSIISMTNFEFTKPDDPTNRLQQLK